jgi:hypothetical protein
VDSKFSLLLEDFCPALGWEQAPLLNPQQMVAAIEALARFHAFFWNGGVHNHLLTAVDIAELERSVWGVASHWAPSRQASEMMDNISRIWKEGGYGDATVGFGDGSHAHMQLGERLQLVAKGVAEVCHFDGESSTKPSAVPHPHRTIIHGDAKAGNLFFRYNTGDSDNQDNNNAPVSVGLIDFQWCGFGLGGTDLAYFIASCADSSSVDVSGAKEAALLRSYHAVLLSELDRLQRDCDSSVARGAFSAPSFDELLSQYEAGLLDICRIAFAYHWGRIPACPAVFTPERRAMLGPCAYNKDTAVARWLVARCDSLLSKRENALANNKLV